MSETIEALLEKVPYSLMLFFSLGLLLLFFFPGLASIKVELDNSQKADFQKAVVLENLVSVHPEPDQEESLDYELDDRRSVIAAEYFTQKSKKGGIGYKVKDSRNCYIPDVKGLDGENYAFRIIGLENQGVYDFPTGCGPGPRSHSADPLYAPVIIKGEEGTVPARVMVYEAK